MSIKKGQLKDEYGNYLYPQTSVDMVNGASVVYHGTSEPTSDIGEDGDLYILIEK